MIDSGQGDTEARDKLAKVLDPEAFKPHRLENAGRSLAILQWSARRHMAMEGADRLIVAGYVTTAEADRRVAEARSEMGMAHAIISRAREAVRDGYERDQIALILNNRVRGWDSALSPTESEAPNEPSEL